jgi:hypothetical protein
MRNVTTFVLSLATATPFAACHTAHAADPPRSVSPSIDLEIEDRGPDLQAHVAKLTLVVVDGHADLKARDGESTYELKARSTHDTDARLELALKREERGTAGALDVAASIPEKPGGRILVARVDRPAGRSTVVIAQVR